MNRHHYIDPTIAAILESLAPDNLGFPQITPPRDPFASDETPDNDAPAVTPRADEE